MSSATLRSLHGLLALSLSALLALYAVSGWMIIHRVDLGAPREHSQAVRSEPVGGAGEAIARVKVSAQTASSAAGLAGARIGKARFADGVWRVDLSRIARSAEVTLTPGAAEARVAARDLPIGTAAKSLHRITADGARGGRLAWVIGADALSLALLAFAATGVLMFRALRRDRRLGWALLGAGTLYTVGGIAWLAFSA